MVEYKNYLAAVKILKAAQDAAFDDLGTAFNNPAWSKLLHAIMYLKAQVQL